MLSEKGAKTLLGPNSPEFAQLEYQLQLTLKSSTARMTQAFALSNPHLSLQFDRRCKDLLVLPTWVDASHLGGINTEEDVIRRGFQFAPSQQGLKFVVEQAGGVRKALLCELGQRRCYCQMDTTEEIDSYQYEYYILPKYLVTFEWDLEKEKQTRERPMCESCEEELATVYCAADAAYFCNRCDSQQHQTKIASRHARTSVGEGSNIFGNCRHHTDKPIEYFCSQCHIPVCVVCKMVGNHANGEAAKHQLVNVLDAYQTPDPILQSRRQDITNQIQAINSRARAVEKMGTQLEASIEEVYKKAMRELRTIIQHKLTVLLGDELELRRQMAEMDRLEEFLKYQEQGDATTYLFNWSRHQNVREQLHDFAHFRNTIDITGTLSVTVDVEQPKPPQPVQKQAPPKLGLGVPHKMERKVQRRVSDFFAETLGSFDQLNTYDDEETDHYSEVSYA
ncbi:hypothetical protein EDD86DRAFT_248451 [Gorgonomyces haynaldii]|nr:hypothetical protein EDD86DRAFT_248451 [Gorgonomyces haynaldii]